MGWEAEGRGTAGQGSAWECGGILLLLAGLAARLLWAGYNHGAKALKSRSMQRRLDEKSKRTALMS